MKPKKRIQEMTFAALLTAIAILIPSIMPIKLIIPPASYTLGSHVPIFLAMFIGSIAAGPMYAAFPFTAVLIKKGAKFSNIIIFMNAWCVTKISTLLFEISSLGYKFTFVRLLIDIPGVIIMGILVEKFLSKDELTRIYHT